MASAVQNAAGGRSGFAGNAGDAGGNGIDDFGLFADGGQQFEGKSSMCALQFRSKRLELGREVAFDMPALRQEHRHHLDAVIALLGKPGYRGIDIRFHELKERKVHPCRRKQRAKACSHGFDRPRPFGISGAVRKQYDGITHHWKDHSSSGAALFTGIFNRSLPSGKGNRRDLSNCPAECTGAEERFVGKGKSFLGFSIAQ